MSFLFKHWGKLIFLLFILFWQGIPAFNRWKADKLVDELCAKDGGIKVYETVGLSKERFDKWGTMFVPDKRFMKPDNDYFSENYYQFHEKDKNPEWVKNHRDQRIEIIRAHVKYYRKHDSKLLGESISYMRRGGEAIGPWHISSYVCSVGSETDLNKQIFLKVE
jgi:hypothetical protein